MSEKKFFNSKWPIVEAAMNTASNKQLALAVSEAGGFPSLWTMPAYTDSSCMKLDFDPMFSALTDFIKSNGSANVIVPISVGLVLEKNFLKIAKDLKISHWEIVARHKNHRVCSSEFLNDDRLYKGINYLQRYSKVIGRLLCPVANNPRLNIYDAVEIKGSDSAGGLGYQTVEQSFDEQIKYSNTVIPYGGVGTPDQVKQYIQKGAPAVGVGTLFAVCVESPLSTETKIEMISKSSKDISVVKGDPDGKLELNAIVLDQSIKTDGSENRGNHTDELHAGIYGNGKQGLIFAGHGIDHVDRIRTVKETMEYLTSKL